MSQFNIISATSESTVVAEYTPDACRSDSYQSEAALEQEFLRLLCAQGYEYLEIHDEAALIANLRRQLEGLNDYVFSDSEWTRFFRDCIAGVNDGILEKTRRIQLDHVQVLRQDSGASKNIYLLDKKHIHNHIYWNAVTLDYKHKFRDFLGSWRAVSRLSDLICLEHQLSVVQNPKRYTHSHYGKWLGNRAKSSHRELARIAIDDALSKHPHTFDAFLDLLQQSGYTVKRGKHLTLCKPGQKNIRFDSLKKEYTEDAIRAVISGKKQRQTREQKPIPAQQNVQKMQGLVINIA